MDTTWLSIMHTDIIIDMLAEGAYPYTGDTGYEHMDLSAVFWATMHGPNADHPLTLWLTIGETSFSSNTFMTLRSMARLAAACKWFFSILQKRLTWCHDLRFRWVPRVARRIVPYLVRKTHPFKYTGRRYRLIPVNIHMGVVFGLQFLNGQTFDDADIIRYAVADLWLFTHSPIDITVYLYVAGTLIITKTVRYTDYIYQRNSNSDTEDSHVNQSRPWMVPLCLPTRFNPLTLGAPILDPRLLTLNIMPADMLVENIGSPPVDPFFLLNNFTDILVEFRTVAARTYDWDQYGMTFNGEVNTHANTTSLVRRLTDVTDTDTQADDDGIDYIAEVERYFGAG
jgi:hypothetical protein